MLLALAMLAVTSDLHPELDSYIARPEPAATWHLEIRTSDRTTIDLTSQRWHGVTWKHKIVMMLPDHLDYQDSAILYITGGEPNALDIAEAKDLANRSGMRTALLFDIPNQPIWDHMEDDLIAHTFEKYLDTGDATWPLLFPMVKSAVKAMDAISDVDRDIKKFVVTGASKRGWTAWLVGASGDKRVAGIAPMVIDNLNVGPQMKHQLESWGEYSEQIQDYTRRGLQDKAATPAGQKLAAMIDPISYADRLTMPKLIVNGANDRYWTVDALSLYWDLLKGPKSARVVPNAGHLLGDKKEALEAVGAFARSCAGEFPLPQPVVELREGEPTTLDNKDVLVAINQTSGGLVEAKVWTAESSNLDFRDKEWTVSHRDVVAASSNGHFETRLRVPAATNVALFVEMRYQIAGYAFSLTSPVKVFRKSGS